MLTAGLWCCSTFIGRFAWCWWGPWFSTQACLQSTLPHTHFMFLKWMHPDCCTQPAALCDCAQWTANQKQLNSLCTTTTTTSEWQTSFLFSSYLFSLILLKHNRVRNDQSMMMFDAVQKLCVLSSNLILQFKHGHQILEIMLWAMCVGGESIIDGILIGRKYFSSGENILSWLKHCIGCITAVLSLHSVVKKSCFCLIAPYLTVIYHCRLVRK